MIFTTNDKGIIKSDYSLTQDDVKFILEPLRDKKPIETQMRAYQIAVKNGANPILPLGKRYAVTFDFRFSIVDIPKPDELAVTVESIQAQIQGLTVDQLRVQLTTGKEQKSFFDIPVEKRDPFYHFDS